MSGAPDNYSQEEEEAGINKLYEWIAVGEPRCASCSGALDPSPRLFGYGICVNDQGCADARVDVPVAPVPATPAPVTEPEATCATCKRTRLGEGHTICSNPFHLPDEFRTFDDSPTGAELEAMKSAPVPEDREEATADAATACTLMPGCAFNAGHSGQCFGRCRPVRKSATAIAMAQRLADGLRADHDSGDFGRALTDRVALADSLVASLAAADHGHTEGPNG